MIEASGLSFGYIGEDDVFRAFNWSAAKGEFWVLLGPSGCGKTTLLHLLAGLRRPKSGRIIVGGQEVVRPRCSTGPHPTGSGVASLGNRARERSPRPEITKHQG